MLFFKKHQQYLPAITFFLLLLFSIFHIYSNFPTMGEYHMRNDEGNYFRQASLISQQGLDGYKTVMSDYLTHPEMYDTPTPLRIFHIQLASIAIDINPSITSLSFLSLGWFIALCIMSWFFIRKVKNEKTAFVACSILAFSPLLNGMATRALMDSEVCFFTLLALYSLMEFINSGKFRDGLIMVISLTAGILIKEPFLVIYPFFPLMLMYFGWRKKTFGWRAFIFISLLPILLVTLSYWIVFGNLSDVIKVYQVISQVNILHPASYTATYCSGPWYQYFTDLFMLSPAVSILFFLFTGYYFFSKDKKDGFLLLLLFYVIWFIATHSLLPKNVRYATSLEPIYALFAALSLIKISECIPYQKMKTPALALMIVFILALQIRSFNHYFRDGKLYDPISYNLQELEKIIP